jgi:hypothetical protein
MRPLAVVLLCAGLAACATAPRETQAPVAQQIALPPPPPPGEPADIAGIEETQLRGIFGAPSFIRKDGHAQMWRYDSAGCKAFFFLYPSAGTFAVRHVETVPRGNEIAADSTCLAALRAHPNATPVS